MSSTISDIHHNRGPALAAHRGRAELYCIITSRATSGTLVRGTVGRVPGCFTSCSAAIGFVAVSRVGHSRSSLPRNNCIVEDNGANVGNRGGRIVRCDLGLSSGPRFATDILITFTHTTCELGGGNRCNYGAIFSVPPTLLSRGSKYRLHGRLLWWFAPLTLQRKSFWKVFGKGFVGGVFCPGVVRNLGNCAGRGLLGSVVTNMVITVVTLPLSVTLTLTSNIGPRRNLCATVVTKFIVTLLNNDHIRVSNPATTFTAVITKVITAGKLRKLTITALATNIVLVLVNLLELNGLVGFVPRAVTINFANNVTLALLVNRIGSFTKLGFARSPVRALRGLVRIVGAFGAFG